MYRLNKFCHAISRFSWSFFFLGLYILVHPVGEDGEDSLRRDLLSSTKGFFKWWGGGLIGSGAHLLCRLNSSTGCLAICMNPTWDICLQSRWYILHIPDLLEEARQLPILQLQREAHLGILIS